MPIGARGSVLHRGRILCAAAVIAPLGACQTARINPEAEESITRAVGLPELVSFRVEGAPVDEADSAANSLSLADAVRRAVMTDPGLQSALARVRIAMAEADQARLLPNPILSFVLRWGPGKPVIEAGLAQDLIEALQIPRRSSAADHRLRLAAADAVGVALDVVAEVQARYAAVQAEAGLVPVLESRLELLGRLAGVARNRLESGEGVRGDVTTAEAQRVELEIEITESQVRQREERLRLARLIGEPSSAASWTLEPWTPPQVGSMSEDAWIATALAHRPEVQAVAWRLAALGDDYALTHLLPWEGAGAGVEVERDEDWSAGPSISTPIPIFDTGDAKRQRVIAEQIEARHDLTLAKRRVVEEVRVALQSLAANTATLDRIRRELIPLQEQRRQQAEDAYRAGQTDVTALFLAEQDLGAAGGRAIELERLTTLSLIQLERAVGGPGVARTVGTTPPESPNPSPIPSVSAPASANDPGASVEPR